MRQFICIVNFKEYKDIFTLLSDDIMKVADIIKNNYIENYFDEGELETLNSIDYVDKIYELFAKVYDTRQMNTDTVKMDKILEQISSVNGEDYYTTDVSDLVRQLVVGVSYNIIYHNDEIIIQRFEEVYCSANDQWSMRRELSDYNKKGNLFDLDDKVRVKGSDKIYTVYETPVPVFNDQWWRNMYCIRLSDNDPEMEIHESELEKVEE